MRERLIELLKRADKYASGVCTDYDEAQEVCADFLLAEGVIVPPCKVGETVYAISQMRDKRIMPFINSYSASTQTHFALYVFLETVIHIKKQRAKSKRKARTRNEQVY